ncbi:MAG: histidinol-phosphate transaminase [Rhodospirillaceae bacterium]|nr:MAG: histidinol-phosphate transaminase [Rhodospirillaceae bacterium]
MAALKVRPGILQIAPYVGGASHLPGMTDVMKLSSNESALGPSPKAIEAYLAAATDLHRYPDGRACALREAIGQLHSLNPDRIVCGNGSDDLLALLARAYAGPEDEILYSAHGFLLFPILAHGVGATPIAVPEKDMTVDVDGLLARVTPRTRIVFLANPNNPTGSYLNGGGLRRLRKKLPSDVLLVIDAAYAEFVTAADYTPGVDLVDAGENVVMTRTFSKIFALSALRLGWAYCPGPVADVLNRLRAPFNVVGPAQAAGIAALKDVAFFDQAKAHNTKWRAWLAEALGKSGLHVYPSVANFLLVRFPDDPSRNAEAANRALNERGILPRKLASYGLPDCLRITIGKEKEMRAVAATLADFMK